MKSYNVFGVSSSIALNKNNGYFAVGYFDENSVTIHDYYTGDLIHKIKTNYCSSANNILACNDDYLIVLHEAKTINIFDAKKFEIISSFHLNNCGAVNSILIEDDLVIVTTNKAIGNLTIKNDIFFYEIKNRKLTSNESGLYLRKSFLLKGQLFLVGNGLSNNSFIVPYLKSENLMISLPILVDEVIVYEHNTNEYVKVFLNTGLNDVGNTNFCINVYPSLNMDVEDEILEKTVVGYLGKNELIKITFNNQTEKYKYSRYGEKEVMEYLDFDVITHSSACDNTNFCFGADKKIVFIEIN